MTKILPPHDPVYFKKKNCLAKYPPDIIARVYRRSKIYRDNTGRAPELSKQLEWADYHLSLKNSLNQV